MVERWGTLDAHSIAPVAQHPIIPSHPSTQLPRHLSTPSFHRCCRSAFVSPSGLLNLNKPVGITSRRAVDYVQRLDRRTKVGHAGTLDPLASGVLVLCVGAATRLIECVQRMPKQYSACFLLGRQSPTEDMEGEVVELAGPPVPTIQQIQAAATALTGEILQRPPAYSALKLKGRRACDLARQGREVELEARKVVIHRIDVAGYDYPELRLDIRCGSGTYVRSLGRDLAESLGTAAVMSALVRTAIGCFRIEDALDPASLTATDWAGHLLPSRLAVEDMPQLTLDADEVRRVLSGRPIPARSVSRDAPEIAALDASGQLVALLVRRVPDLLGPVRVFGAGDVMNPNAG
ncbi:MAG: tRNA pseudouridine(55) synthase TruB [Pirellulales bacterium]|nr:tRNA pseudouridine(55) synthase TruB [Pirellulales bacterium]